METTTKKTTNWTITKFVAVAAAAALTFTGCSLESIAETAAEKALSAETGEDVNLDFDSSTGGFTIETDEGTMVLDAETGEFVITDANGDSTFDATFSADDGGINVESSEGSLSFDAESGEFVVTDENGEQVADGVVDADGETIQVSAEGADGEETFSLDTGADTAQDWPNDVLAVYPGATVAESMVMDTGEGAMNMLSLQTSDDAASVMDFYKNATDSWEDKTVATTPEGGLVVATSQDWTTQITVDSSGSDGTTVNLMLVSERT